MRRRKKTQISERVQEIRKLTSSTKGEQTAVRTKQKKNKQQCRKNLIS